jgi:hypothetical protein
MQQNKHQKFEFFPKLPTELKLRILHFSMPGPRLIRIRSKYRTIDRKKVWVFIPFIEHFSREAQLAAGQDGCDMVFEKYRNPAFLFVDRDFQAEMLKHYHACEHSRWSQLRGSESEHFFTPTERSANDTRYVYGNSPPLPNEDSVLYVNFKLDNLGFDCDQDIRRFFSTASMTGLRYTTDLEEHLRHLTVRLQNVNSYSLLSTFEVLETITFPEPDCSRSSSRWPWLVNPPRARHWRGTVAVEVKSQLRSNLEAAGGKIPAIIDIIHGGEHQSFRRVMGEGICAPVGL